MLRDIDLHLTAVFSDLLEKVTGQGQLGGL